MSIDVSNSNYRVPKISMSDFSSIIAPSLGSEIWSLKFKMLLKICAQSWYHLNTLYLDISYHSKQKSKMVQNNKTNKQICNFQCILQNVYEDVSDFTISGFIQKSKLSISHTWNTISCYFWSCFVSLVKFSYWRKFHFNISSLVLELWQFSFTRDWPEIWKFEIPRLSFTHYLETGVC